MWAHLPEASLKADLLGNLARERERGQQHRILEELYEYYRRCVPEGAAFGVPELEATHSARWVQHQGGRDLEDSRDGSGQLHPQREVQTWVITYEHEAKTFGYDCAIRYLADVVGIGEPDVCACFVEKWAASCSAYRWRRMRVTVVAEVGRGCA